MIVAIVARLNAHTVISLLVTAVDLWILIETLTIAPVVILAATEVALVLMKDPIHVKGMKGLELKELKSVISTEGTSLKLLSSASLFGLRMMLSLMGQQSPTLATGMVAGAKV